MTLSKGFSLQHTALLGDVCHFLTSCLLSLLISQCLKSGTFPWINMNRRVMLQEIPSISEIKSLRNWVVCGKNMMFSPNPRAGLLGSECWVGWPVLVMDLHWSCRSQLLTAPVMISTEMCLPMAQSSFHLRKLKLTGLKGSSSYNFRESRYIHI